MSQPTPSVPTANHLTILQLASFIPCPFHIAVDFVTGLPPSDGNTTILTIIDRFSKSIHFVSLPKLLSALETTILLIRHIFRLHSTGHCFGPGAPVILPSTGGLGQSVFWLSLPDGAGKQSLESSLQCVACHLQASWSTHLPWVEYAHNSHVSSAPLAFNRRSSIIVLSACLLR